MESATESLGVSAISQRDVPNEIRNWAYIVAQKTSQIYNRNRIRVH